MTEIYFQSKQIFVTTHAIKRAREREIAYPDHVYHVLKTGKVEKFGKNGIKFISKSKKGPIICVGEISARQLLLKQLRGEIKNEMSNMQGRNGKDKR